uniref:DUF4142 domain-containing protein n=1 Tax=Microvirga roseola TaxID=2883126 RepID=UPI001E5C2DEA
MKLRLMAILASTALMPVAAMAQTGNQSQQQRTQAQSAQAGQMQASDFVNRAAVSNMFEIESSRLAQQRSQNDRVRQFAQRMIQDHTQATERLQSVVQNIDGVSVPSNLDQQHQQMLRTLQSASGQGFDRAYVQMQVTAHRNAVNLFQQYAQNGDNQQLQQFAQQTVPTLREHLQSIQQIQNALPPAQVGATQGQQQMAQGQRMQAQDDAEIVVRQPAPTVRVNPA